MRGVSLIELLAGMSLFLLLLFFSYHALDLQQRVLKRMVIRSQPEQESNYRLLLMKHFVERSSRKLRIDPVFEDVPVFFTDLSFGKTSLPNAFSVAHVTGVPVPFVRFATYYKMPAGSAIEEKNTYLLAGADSAGNFTWTYARAEKVWVIPEGIAATFQPLTANADPQTGKLIAVEIHGFLFKEQTLYWVSPAGTLQPYLSSLESFEYSCARNLLRFRWKAGETEMEARCVL